MICHNTGTLSLGNRLHSSRTSTIQCRTPAHHICLQMLQTKQILGVQNPMIAKFTLLTSQLQERMTTITNAVNETIIWVPKCDGSQIHNPDKSTSGKETINNECRKWNSFLGIKIWWLPTPKSPQISTVKEEENPDSITLYSVGVRLSRAELIWWKSALILTLYEKDILHAKDRRNADFLSVPSPTCY